MQPIPSPSSASHIQAKTRQLDRHTLPLNTDVAEWCPHTAALRLLAVGTYQLDEATQQRLGALHLFHLKDPGDATPETAADEERVEQDGVQQEQAGQAGDEPHLEQLASLTLPGIFDLRWHPRSAMPTLAAALADGSVRVLDLGSSAAEALLNGGTTASPELLAVVPLEAGEEAAEGMAVSLDYSRCDGCPGEQLAVSYSSGQLQLFQAAPAGMTSLAVWQAHQLEAWAASTDHWHPSLIHSGGDDSAYRVWDSRQGFDAPVWQSSKAHGAGVCCVASSPYQQHMVCTGSYDDRLRLWDLRAPQRPLQLAEVNAGGGVWRAKWHPTNPQLLLAACMYNGFAVLRVDAAAPKLSIISTYEHAEGSLSYGADWCRESPAACRGGEAGTLAATCSFYDRQLHLWDTGE